MTTGQPHGRWIAGDVMLRCLGDEPPLLSCETENRAGRGALSRRLLCHRRNRRGFTLIEIIVSLLLVGVIASFSTVFLVSGVENFFLTREAVEAAFRAEVALNRIALELRSMDENGLTANPVVNTSITYTSDDTNLPGTRALEFKDGNLYLKINTTDYLLMGNVSSPVLNATYADMDNDGNNEVAHIDVGFTVGSIPAFSIRVYPRNMVAQPGT